MTASEVLQKVLKAGGKIVSDAKGSRLRVPPALKALVVEHRDALRQLIVYRETCRRWWSLTAQGPEADRGEVATTHQELLRLIDEVGEPRAITLRRQWALEWWQETGVCPHCGARGQYHDPGQDKENTMATSPESPTITIEYGEHRYAIHVPPQAEHLTWQEVALLVGQLIQNIMGIFREDGLIAARVAKRAPGDQGAPWRREIHLSEIQIAVARLKALGALDSPVKRPPEA